MEKGTLLKKLFCTDNQVNLGTIFRIFQKDICYEMLIMNLLYMLMPLECPLIITILLGARS